MTDVTNDAAKCGLYHISSNTNVFTAHLSLSLSSVKIRTDGPDLLLENDSIKTLWQSGAPHAIRTSWISSCEIYA